MKRLNYLRSLVAIAVFVVGVVGNAEFFASAKSYEGHTRLIRASVKIKSPGRVLTFVGLISRPISGEIRIEACDALGLTQAMAFISPMNVKLFDMTSKCRHDLRLWRMSLVKAMGIDISYEQIVDWLFPEIWPKENTTIKISRRGFLNLRIEQYPPCDGSRGMVRIKLPAHKIEIMVQRLGTETVGSNIFSEESPGPDWGQCDGLPLLSR